MTEDHLKAPRGWALIRDRERLTAAEVEHLTVCPNCNAWFTSFTDRARSAGFVIAFDIPVLKKDEERAKGA
jgi:predicted anti-sigma-YlaC factor YlaD